MLWPLAGSLGPLGQKFGGGVVASPFDDVLTYWRCEEASGARVDARGVQNLTDVNSVVVNAIGKHGNCASFPATGELNHTYNAAAQFGNSGAGGSVSMWFLRSANPTVGSAGLGGENVGANPGWGLRCIASGTPGRVSVFIRDANNTVMVCNTLTGYCDDAWHHVAWTYTPADHKLRLYVDGSLLVTSTATGTHANIKHSSGGHVYGRDRASLTWNYDSAARAYVDEIATWDRFLTGPEVTQINAGGPGLFF